jgi:hypothetical protein
MPGRIISSAFIIGDRRRLACACECVGDVIGETRAGAAGFLLYAGGKYAWYDPSTPK